MSDPKTILIIKTSALGDIVQSFHVLDYLLKKFPSVKIDWAIEASLAPLISAHPLVNQVIPLNLKRLRKSIRAWRDVFHEIRQMRRVNYDIIFDLQGNCKSGLLTLFSRGKEKVGFGWNSVREKPNLLATNVHFEVPRKMNIRLQYVRLVQKFFKEENPLLTQGLRLRIDLGEQEKIRKILSRPELSSSMKVMVCPGSKWSNKQLPVATLLEFLTHIQGRLNASFLLMWGAENEKLICRQIAERFCTSSVIVDKLEAPTWQNLMDESDLVIAVDSSALHLCGTTATPSFSLFGPTSPEIFMPIGSQHHAMQGPCPYGRTFAKACPVMRTCPTGACLGDLKAGAIFSNFLAWWEELQMK